jgi:hypothetical protein
MPVEALAPLIEKSENAEQLAEFERACQRYLHMSTADFLQKMDSGYFLRHPELARKAADVALLLPLLSAR